MLDFYLIKDDQPNPNDPEQVGLMYAGSLDNKTFNNLQNKGVFDERLDYYSDFRLGTAMIKQIRQSILHRKMEMDSDVIKLLDIFNHADSAESGLIAFGD